MTTSREQFESWASDNGKWPRAVERSGDAYLLISTNTKWEAWQASRWYLHSDPDSEYMKADDVISVIRAAGITGKGD